MAFGNNINNVQINGQSSVEITPKSGSLSAYGFVAEPVAEADSIDYDTTVGKIPSGHTWKLSWKGVQTQAANVTDAINTRQLSKVTFKGPSDTLSITDTQTGIAALFMATKVIKKWSGKADSFIEQSIEVPGVAFATSITFMS